MGGGDVNALFWWEDLMERDHLEDPNLDGDNIKIFYIFKKQMGSVNWSGLGRRQMMGSSESGNWLDVATETTFTIKF